MIDPIELASEFFEELTTIVSVRRNASLDGSRDGNGSNVSLARRG